MFQAENRGLRALSAALEGTRVELAPASSNSDLVAYPSDGQPISLTIKWAGLGWPQQVRQAASEIEEPWPNNLIIVAKHFSPGALEWMRERGANWADETGQARILGPNGLVVVREPAPGPSPESAGKATIKWSKSAIGVAEFILSSPDHPLRTKEIAIASGWSVPQVASVLQVFDTQGWTAKRGPARGPSSYRDLIDADGMLNSWSTALLETPRESRIVHRATKDVMSYLRDELTPLMNESVAWAVSGWGALELLAPFSTATPSLHVYVAETDFVGTLDRVFKDARLREVDEGGRFTFWSLDDRLLAQPHRVKNTPVTTPPRLFADLSSFGGRGHDVAIHAKEELFDPLHDRPLESQ